MDAVISPPAQDPNDPTTWPVGRAEQVEPLVRRVLAANPSPYTFTGTETYIVGTGSDVAVIDPGPAGSEGPYDATGHVAAILAAIGKARLAAIMCTHTPRDHSAASRDLKAATGARSRRWRRPGIPAIPCATRWSKAGRCSPATM